jgi:hypothetical protein
MPERLPLLRHIRPIRDRALLLQRQDELAAEMQAVDAEPTAGYDHRKFARPALPGPSRIAPALPDAASLRGRPLRRAALKVLAQAGGALELPTSTARFISPVTA